MDNNIFNLSHIFSAAAEWLESLGNSMDAAMSGSSGFKLAAVILFLLTLVLLLCLVLVWYVKSIIVSVQREKSLEREYRAKTDNRLDKKLVSFDETAEKIARQFSCPLRAYDSLGDFALPAGAHVSEPVQHLFARRSYKEIEEQYDALHAAKAAKAGESGNAQPFKPEAEAKTEKPASKEKKGHEANFPAEISIDDFAKVKMQVAEVIACEKVPKADKLLKSTVKIGEETRTVVSGIAQYYTPEQMVGRKVIMVTNLKPAKLRGIVSEGMILCAEDAEGNLQLLAPAGDIGSGSTIY